MTREDLATMTCNFCEELWKAYEDAVFEHVRLCSRHKLAVASGDPSAIAKLGDEAGLAEQRRLLKREALLDHERESGHGS